MWRGWRGEGRPFGPRVRWAVAALALAPMPPAYADDTGPPGGREVWAGADISENVWLTYSGVTVAPWSGIHDPGWRFRAAGGYGEYSYTKTPAPDDDYIDARPLEFHAKTYFADVLVGYLVRYGDLTAKAFVGIALISHDISPTDEYTVAMGEEIGFKGVVELWLNIGERGWGSLDLSWASAHETRAVRSRIGYRFWPNVSLGMEAGLNVDAQSECRIDGAGAKGCGYADKDETGKVHYYEEADLLDYARTGAFVRYEWTTGEVSLSAGVLGESFGAGDEIELAPYVTLNWLTQFRIYPVDIRNLMS